MNIETPNLWQVLLILVGVVLIAFVGGIGMFLKTIGRNQGEKRK